MQYVVNISIEILLYNNKIAIGGLYVTFNRSNKN
jgi:hypothetical protein